MIRRFRRALFVLLLSALGAGGGCAQAGVEDILGGVFGSPGARGEVVGEVRGVDTRAQRIELRTEDGRSASIRYDRNTRVIFGRREYPVSALERGDVVAIRVREDGRGTCYASDVLVRESVRERGGAVAEAPLQRIEGRVGRIDESRGAFRLQGRYDGELLVTLPYNPSRGTLNEFRRLRPGDLVRLEGRFLGQERFELERFL